MSQRFYASPAHKFEFSNAAIGYSSGSNFDFLGPYAKVWNCPIAGTNLRLTCYATNYADTYFSIPACTRRKGKYIKGYFTIEAGAIEFNPMDSCKALLT